MAVLTHLPPELLHSILSHVEPEDLARISLACRHLNTFIKGNNALCRAIYLRHWDEPPTKILNYEQELHDLVKLKKLCSPKVSGNNAEAQAQLPFVYRTVTRLLQHAAASPAPTGKAGRQPRTLTITASRNAAFLATLFSERSARLNFLARSSLYERGRAIGLLDRSGRPELLAFSNHYGPEPEPESDDDQNDDEVDGENEDEANAGYPYFPPTVIAPRRPHAAPRWRIPRDRCEASQMSAKLHSLYGWSLGLEDGVALGTTDIPAQRRALCAARRRTGAYALACSKVYDMRQYTRGTRWGPFWDDEGDADGEGEGGNQASSNGNGDASGEGDDGAPNHDEMDAKPVRVDWEKVEAILLVLGTNIRAKMLERFPIYGNYWGKPFAGTWPQSYTPWDKPAERNAKAEQTEKDDGAVSDVKDPYGITGNWIRVVSFLDYHDFFDFNHFPPAEGLPRDVPRPPLRALQATRVLLVRIRATRLEPPGPGDHPDHPVAYFTGFSRSMDAAWDDNADADIRGSVRVTPEGEVRWTSYSVYDGEERWKSEGVQLGGIRSARGVVGNWFQKDFNPGGPCGPTAFWKISDRGPDAGESVFVENIFPLIAEEGIDEASGESDSDDGLSEGELGSLWGDYSAEYMLEHALEDEMLDVLDGLYYFNDQDIFDMEDLEGELDPDELDDIQFEDEESESDDEDEDSGDS